MTIDPLLVGHVATGAVAVLGMGTALALAAADGRRGRTWPRGVDGVVLHLQRMGGASIATLTAVFVVNVRTEPEFVAWLIPSAVLIPTFVVLSRRLRRGRPTSRAPAVPD